MLVSVELMRLCREVSKSAEPWGRVTAKALPARTANGNNEAAIVRRVGVVSSHHHRSVTSVVALHG
jgi:hypothetical protein